jgi:hypothetical protein
VASRDGFEKRKISRLCHESSPEPSNPWCSHFTDNAIQSPLSHIMHIRKSHIMNSLSHIENCGRGKNRTYFNAEIKSLRATLPGEIFYWEFAS